MASTHKHQAGNGRHGHRRAPGSMSPWRILVMAIAFLAVGGVVFAASDGARAYVTTDKDDYPPGSVVTISGDNRDGSEWAADETVDVVVTHDENGWTTGCSAETDADGAWSCQITLSSDASIAVGPYTYVATGQESGWSETGHFTDAAIGTYDQCSNDDGDGYDGNPGDCNWINGNLNANNSTYAEGDATVQRVWLTGFVPGANHSVTLQYGTTKGGTHAYDYLTSWDWSENWITEDNLCEGITGCTTADASENWLNIPNDTNVPLAIQAAGPGDREFYMRGGELTSTTVPVIESGSYAGDSETVITVSFTVDNSGPMCETKGQTTTCGIALWFGAHIARTDQWSAFNGTTGAGDIEGSPYHVALYRIDGESVGQRDNQMQANTIVAEPSLSITKTADAASVSAGSQIGFSVTVSNAGPGTATAVTLNDPLPGGAGVDWSISPAYGGPGSCSITGSPQTETLSCAFGDLAAGASATVDVVSNTTAASCKVYNNTASASATNHDTVQASASTEVLCGDIDIEKTADAASVNAGEQIGFTVTVTNNGSGTATGVTVNDPLPGGDGVDWSESPDSANCEITGTAPNQVLECGPTDMAPGASYSVHVVSGTTADSCGTYDNTASVTTTNDGSDEASASTEVLCGDIEIVKTANPTGPVNAGDPIGFDITVSNIGSGTATNVVVTDNLPGDPGLNWSLDPAFTGCEITGAVGSEVLTCNLGTIAAGDSVGPIHVSSPTTEAVCGEVSNTASVTTGNDGSDEDTASVTVDCPVLDVEKSPDGGTVDAGGTLSFAIVVTNLGPGTAYGVTLNDTLPAGFTWTESPDNADCSITGGVLSCSFGNLAEGAFESVTVQAPTGSECGLVDNPAAVADATNAASVQDAGDITINCPTLSVVKTPDGETINAGGDAVFTITVTNDGPGTAFGVTLDDTLPAGFSWTEDSAFCSIAAGVLSCNFGDLADGASASVALTAPTTAAQCGTVDNPAAIADADNAPSAQDSGSLEILCGKIIVIKQTDPDGDPATFDFTADYDANGFSLSDGQQNDSGDLAPGTYSVAEIGKVGWDLTSATCDDGSVVGAISLQANEIITCTFTNQKDANIIVVKETDPDGDPATFDFTASYDGDGFSLSDGQQNDSGDVAPGTYAVAETVPTGWDLTSATCSDGSDPAAIDLAAGETVTCTFTNTRRGTIIVEKQTNPNGAAGSFTFAGDAAGSIADDGQIVVSNLVPGAYSSTETVHTGWDLTSIVCDDANSSGDTETGTATFNLEAGETVQCVFTNTQRGTIIINKTAIGGDDTFGYVSDVANKFLTTVGGTASYTYINVVPGSHFVREALGANLPAGWDFNSLVCTDPDDGTAIVNAQANIDLDPGETVECTWTNTKRGKIIVEKVCVGASEGTFGFEASYQGDFSVDCGGSDESDPLVPGDYDVAETILPVDWDFTGAECSDRSDPSAISLQAGETVTCTFVNTKRGKIIVEKVCVGASEGSFGFEASYQGDFSVDCGGSNESDPLVPGDYDVAETNLPEGWDLTGAVCDDESEPDAISLQAGETVTCTFTNTKRGEVTVIKTENGATPTTVYTFRLTGGPDDVNITRDTSAGGTLEFGLLKPGDYTICELAVPAGTASTLEDQGGVVDPNTGDICLNFSLSAGEDKTFTVDNSYPGGGQRTIGYWKNWNSCSHDGAFADRAAKTGNHLADEFLPLGVGSYVVDTCAKAVHILSKQDTSGKNQGSDAAYGLAAQLLAAKLNYAAGASQCASVSAAITQADTQLAGINFDATGTYFKGNNKTVQAQRALALQLATLLDNYNNGLVC